MAKGDFVEVVWRNGQGTGHDVHVITTGGRRFETSIEKDSGITWLQIQEQTPAGTDMGTARYRLDEIVSYTIGRNKEASDG